MRINNPEFSVNVLCESSGMSRTSFYCKLKALTGQSPTEFIRVMRLKRATELLKEGEYAINEISDMVGFSETKYFREQRLWTRIPNQRAFWWCGDLFYRGIA